MYTRDARDRCNDRKRHRKHTGKGKKKKKQPKTSPGRSGSMRDRGDTSNWKLRRYQLGSTFDETCFIGGVHDCTGYTGLM